SSDGEVTGKCTNNICTYAAYQDLYKTCDGSNSCADGLYCDPTSKQCLRPASTQDGILPSGQRQIDNANEWWNQNKFQFDKNVINGSNIDNTIRGWTNSVGWSFAGLITQVDSDSSSTRTLNTLNNNSAIGVLATGISTMITTPPSSTTEYIADIGRNIGIVKPAYAQQGMGWDALEPVQKVWAAFRNIAYLFFVIIFIVIGFMIMFKSQIGQQGAITLQSMLPQIIITLLLITFSYAIASLVIDLIYFLIYLIASIFATSGLADMKNLSATGDVNSATQFINKNIFQLFADTILGGTVLNAAGSVNTLIENLIGGILGTGLGFLTSVVVYLIFAIAMLVSLFKLFFKLLLAYIGIIFSIIFAPFILLTNALPGSQAFMNWLKGIFANALVFPATAAMFMLAFALSGNGNLGSIVNSGSSKSLVLPFLAGGGVGIQSISALIGFGILMFMPGAIESIQKAIGVQGGMAGMMGQVMAPIAASSQFFGGLATKRADVGAVTRASEDKGGFIGALAKTWVILRGLDYEVNVRKSLRR
ncbi:hypothetical protein GYA19_04850, partial [Candidatus Beckwithbacteria bacterium]|nr:hypothetical protein [Candidatus Beckwithbacteria bacterium]